MAIVIHAKNIYDEKNEKVVDNVIGKVEYSQDDTFIEYSNVQKAFVISEKISILNPTSPNVSFSTYSTSSGDFLIGTFVKNAREGTNILEIILDSEPSIALLEDSTTIGNNEAFGFSDMDSFKAHITQNAVKSILGGWLYIEDTDFVFNTDNTYCFAVKKSAIDSTFQVKWNGNADVYKYTYNAKTYTNGTDNKGFTLNSNELMQNTTTIGTDTVASSLSDKILDDYANGKETAELLCSIGEYYNEDNTIAISTKQSVGEKTKMSFAIDDVVIPYICTPTGEIPMSKYKNGTPKQFIVTATEIIFDGAVWQKLTLQEKKI